MNTFLPFAAFLLSSVFTIHAATSATPVLHSDGIDWGLPASTKMTDGAGYLSWNPNWIHRRRQLDRYQDGSTHFATILMIAWGDLNPGEGVYDWRKLDQNIRFSTKNGGAGVVLCVVTYSKSHPKPYPNLPQSKVIPAWVEAKGRVSYLSNDAPAPWEPGSMIQKYHGIFLKEFGRRYKNDPRVVAVNMAGLDCEHGEWCWRGRGGAGWDAEDIDSVLREAEEKTGLTPETYEAWGRRFIDDHVEAFKPRQHKLVWMSGEDNAIWSPRRSREYIPATRRLWGYAYQRGCGGRDGAVEVWNRYLNPGHGMDWTREGYLEVDNHFAPFRNNAIWYTENEFFRNEWPRDELWLRWFTSSMRLLQMRRQWVAVGNNLEFLEQLDPEFLRYVELSLGKTSADSPDAWCWLREGYPKRDRPLKNYERWLFQRDIAPDGITRPAKRVEIGSFARSNRYVFAEDHEFQARSTDVARGRRAIYFRVDPDFVRQPAKRWALVVSYLDQGDARWQVGYSNASGRAATPIVRNNDTGKLKSARFELPGLSFGQAFKGMDLRISCLGQSDLTVQLVRLIRE